MLNNVLQSYFNRFLYDLQYLLIKFILSLSEMLNRVINKLEFYLHHPSKSSSLIFMTIYLPPAAMVLQSFLFVFVKKA